MMYAAVPATYSSLGPLIAHAFLKHSVGLTRCVDGLQWLFAGVWRQVQARIFVHDTCEKQMDDIICGCSVPRIFKGCVIWIKRRLQHAFLLDDLGLLKTPYTHEYVLALRRTYIRVSILAMLFFSFYVWLWSATIVQDNMVCACMQGIEVASAGLRE